MTLCCKRKQAFLKRCLESVILWIFTFFDKARQPHYLFWNCYVLLRIYALLSLLTLWLSFIVFGLDLGILLKMQFMFFKFQVDWYWQAIFGMCGAVKAIHLHKEKIHLKWIVSAIFRLTSKDNGFLSEYILKEEHDRCL